MSDPADPQPRRPKTDSLADTNNVVNLNESGVGPLTAMKTVNDENEFDFDSSQPLPDKVATVQKTSDPAPANSTVVCAGTIWVSGTQTPCTAYRPN